MLAFLDTFLATLFIIICVLLIFVVLLQKGRGGGLSAAFSGMGSTAFGTRVGDVLTWVTIVMTGLFLVLATSVTLRFKPKNEPAAAPIFNPAARPIHERTRVLITGPANSKVWYTLNEREPKKDTKGSTFYTAAVWVEPGQTLKARAYVDGIPESEVTTATYTREVEAATKPAVPTTAPAAATAPAAPVTTKPAPAVEKPLPSTLPAPIPATVPAH